MREEQSLILRDAFRNNVPVCAASCIASAESQSDCSSEDTLCLCSSEEFLEDTLECAIRSCSADEAGSTQDVLDQQCENAIVNADPGPDRPRKSTTSELESSPTSTQTSTHTTSRQSSIPIISTASSSNIASLTLTLSPSLPASTSRSSQPAISSIPSDSSIIIGSQPPSTSSSIFARSSSASTGTSVMGGQRGSPSPSSPSSSANSTSTSFSTVPSSTSGDSSRRPSAIVILALAVSLGAVALLALVLSCILCAKRSRHRRALASLEDSSFEPVASPPPSWRAGTTSTRLGSSQMSEDPEGKHEGIDSLSVAPKLPGTGNDRDAPRAPNPNPIQPTHDSVALSDISPATQPQVAEQHALVGSTPVSESAAVASQSLTAQVDVPPEFTRSCELTPGSASPSTQIPSELTAPNSEKPTDPAMSSTRGSDNTTSGWHGRSSQQELDSFSSSQHPLLSPRDTGSSGVHIIAWNSEFMEEDEPPPYEPRS